VRVATWFAFLFVVPAFAQLMRPQQATTPLRVEGDHFLLQGKPFQILSGELEYARVPRADWRDRLRKVRAMGLNTITVYVFWNLHERQQGVYDFSGQNDVAEYVREAQQEGLYVVLRPGPYVCAEWDLGGYPAWLLKADKAGHVMQLRGLDPEYLAAARRWMLRLGKELAPLQASRGGPIIAVQVENEYGSFEVDAPGKFVAAREDRAAYLKEIRQIDTAAGFGESLLYTADGGDVLEKGSIPGLLAAVDYGTGDASRSLALLKKFQPDAPVYAAEYWDGWFDHWGGKHQLTNAAKQEAEVRAVISQGHSINLYMIHGGTTFGWMNGANVGHDDLNTGDYQPDVSSYDYDAPIDESGRLRPKYFAMRTMIEEVTHTEPPPVPESAAMMTLPEFSLTESRSLLRGLPKGVVSVSPRAMEDLGQAYGYILYRTRVPNTGSFDTRGASTLAFDDLHSYARVYVEGKLEGVMDRRLGQKQVTLNAGRGQWIDVLVENTGRINFSTAIRGERAGLLGGVRLNGEPLNHWQNISLPMDEPPTAGYAKGPCIGPCLYRGSFEVAKPGDTFLNTAKLGKGVVWVNGHLLGRYWNVGPMGSLFLPGVWLHAGGNAITVLDLNGGDSVTLSGDDHPTYLEPVAESILKQVPTADR
jgi:beta-galactosidase